MPRFCCFLLIAVSLAAVGCRSFEENAGLFPRLRDRLDPDADHRQPYYRDGDRHASAPAPTHAIAPTYAVAPTSGSCVPCGGGYTSPIYGGGTTLGGGYGYGSSMPTMNGGGYGYGNSMPTTGGSYGIPTGYSSAPSYSSGPVLGTPVYPSGNGSPYQPRRDDELPLPGGYSQPGAVEMGRGVAPRPPGSLPTGK